MLRIIAIGSIILISCSSNSNNGGLSMVSKQSTVSNTVTDNKEDFSFGDCFTFKDSLHNFGVILLEAKQFSDGLEYKVIPILLDETKEGLDRFKTGKAFVSSYPDYTKPSGITKGFQTCAFFSQDKFEFLKQNSHYEGRLSLNDEYKHSTGEGEIRDLAEMQLQLSIWDRMYAVHGKQVNIEELLR
ncbi:hypothetical protein BH10BAC2_BH10BAC2_47410 [soil metagenome]